MPAKKKSLRVKHLKTGKTEVSVQFTAKTVDITIHLPTSVAKQLAIRLASPNRHLKSIKKARKKFL